jgi:chromosome segregation ATPase
MTSDSHSAQPSIESAQSAVPASSCLPARITVGCPNCAKPLKGRTAYLGQIVRCKKCRTKFPLQLGATLTAVDEQLRLARTQADQLRLRNEELEASIQSAQSEVECHRKRAAQLVPAEEFARGERDQIARELQTRRGELDAALAESDQLRQELEERRRDHGTAFAERDQARQELEQRRQERDAAVAERDQIAFRHQSQGSELASALAQRQELEVKLGVLAQELSRLRTGVDQLTAEREEARKELTQLRETMEMNERALRQDAEARCYALAQTRDAYRDERDRLAEQVHEGQYRFDFAESGCQTQQEPIRPHLNGPDSDSLPAAALTVAAPGLASDPEAVAGSGSASHLRFGEDILLFCICFALALLGGLTLLFFVR